MDRMVVQDTLKFDKPGFQKSDPMRKSLLTKMLLKNPKERIVIGDVLEHAYFAVLKEEQGSKSGTPKSKKRNFTALMGNAKKIE